MLKYLVGYYNLDKSKACIFWQIDVNHEIRTGKIQAYDPETGKRKKKYFLINGEYYDAVMIHKKVKKEFSYCECFFPDKPIHIVESEKTEIIASIFMPQYNWMATGGANGCKWREYSVYKVLKGKNVLLFPDFGYYNKKTLKTCFQEWSERADRIRESIPCTIKVSRLLEENISQEERINDYDLADLLIKRDEYTGRALNDVGYPILLDKNFIHPNGR